MSECIHGVGLCTGSCEEVAVTTKVLDEVLHERRRQEALFGEQNHELPVYLSLLVEEVGEVGRAVNEITHKDSDTGLADAREELVQVAALAVAIVERIDRIGKMAPPEAPR